MGDSSWHAHLDWCENTKPTSAGVSGSAPLPRMKVWVENSVHHTFDHHI